MAKRFHLQCLICSKSFDDDDVNRCPSCGGTFDVVYDDLAHALVDSSARGVWRYFDFLPVHSRKNIVTLGETETALVKSSQLGKRWGLANLHFKIEGMMPTGSYKDRIAAVSMARAKEIGKSAWAATSSGNAGASLSAYGVRAGLPCTLFVLEKASRAGISQKLSSLPRLRASRGVGVGPGADNAPLERMRHRCARNNWML